MKLSNNFNTHLKSGTNTVSTDRGQLRSMQKTASFKINICLLRNTNYQICGLANHVFE
jgi:hypothetical protein